MDGTLHPFSFFEITTYGGLREDPQSTIVVNFLDHGNVFEENNQLYF
jgi:hypothetical protein